MAKTIAVFNQKGGVGKTTSTYHLARAAVLHGKRVLVVDLDPQGSLTDVIAKQAVPDDAVGVADVLSARTKETLADVLVESIWEDLDLAPTSGAALSAVREELVVGGAGREGRLRAAIALVKDQYDLILIDCPPSLDQLAINGLTAADSVLVITHAGLFSINGLSDLLETVASVQQYYNPGLVIQGILVNQHEAGTKRGEDWMITIQEAAATLNLPLLSPAIPKRVVIADSLESGTGLDQWGTPQARELNDLYTNYVNTLENAS